MCRYNPWAAFRRLSGWVLVWFDSPDTLGECDHTARTIRLARGQSAAQRRCTLAHELIHQARGGVPAHPCLALREERIVRRLTACKLIRLGALVDALRWSLSRREVAEELSVDEQTLADRLEHLSPEERAEIHEQLEHHRDSP